MESRIITIVGGGAAGFFAALACAEADPSARISILEQSAQFLAKVRISGGGRCNVTHALFNPREFATRYPRGEKALIGPFTRFQASDTVAWFAARGVRLKTESDGRMFPVTDSSQTIIDCLLNEARKAGIRMEPNRGVTAVSRRPEGGFTLTLSDSSRRDCDRLLLATGGCRTRALGKLPVSLGHTLAEPVPSLFTFHIDCPWLRELAGVAADAAVAVPDARMEERGPILVTHWGLSGPAILRLSAWGARALHERDYRFPLAVNWLPDMDESELLSAFHSRRVDQGARLVINAPVPPLPLRLWEKLVLASGVAPDTRWSALNKASARRLFEQLHRTTFQVTGKSLNKDEFVTCGGIRLSEVNFKTMESRVCPGLYFAGELLDIDGITGGFNFQAAWTTGWIAGRAMAS